MAKDEDPTSARMVAEHEAFRQVLAHVRSSIIVTDLEGRITYWNRGAQAIFGYSADEMLGRTPAQLYPDQDMAALGRDLARILKGEDYEAEWRGRHKDGREIWVLVTTSPMLDVGGKPCGFIGVGTDVTARKEHEREREQLLSELASAKERAELANRTKDEFLALLGHELRNPLSPIVTSLHLMRRRGEAALSRERAVIERQVKHMVRLVDDLLDVSRVTRGKLELRKQPTDLGQVVARALEMTNPLLERHEHRLELSVPSGASVLGDEDRLAQVVANLLTNAAKYTPPGGQIALRVDRHGELIRLSVKDSGEGIAPELLAQLFEPFTQGARSLARPEGGLGLGLALVRALIELHGGSVRVHSAGSGRGSEFVVELPALAQPDAEAPTACDPPELPSPPAGARILIVDDNADAAEMLSEVLADHGYATIVAADAQAARTALQRVTPELAILDIGLPGLDGYGLARELKGREGYANLPLIALTGYGQKQDRERAWEAGFDRHLVKPPDVDRMLRAIAELLGERPLALAAGALAEGSR